MHAKKFYFCSYRTVKVHYFTYINLSLEFFNLIKIGYIIHSLTFNIVLTLGGPSTILVHTS